MKNLFQKWLLLFVVFAFGLTFGLSWFLHRKEAKKNALELLSLNLTDAADRVKRTETNLQTITEMSATAAIAKTRALALIIKETPSILNNQKELKLIREKLDVDEIHIADEKGKLIASVASSNYHGQDHFVGFDLTKAEQSRPFLKAITDPTFELVQEPQYDGVQRLFQYAGVARLDKPGIVQIGYLPERLSKALQMANVKNIEAEMRIGINGNLTIQENTLYPAGHKRVFYTREGLCKSIVHGKYILTVMLPWKEVYRKDRTVITTLFAGNLIVFAAIFFLIAGLLQKVVIKEISAVTDSLDEYSKGNFDKKIDVKGSSEMHALAESINKTVNTLKNQNAAARIENGEEITAILKNSLVPAGIPENANYKFSAEIFSSDEIGRNLCDFFKVDNERIALFFIDASEKGVASGLYMMNIKSMFRNALLKNSPDKALKLVNEDIFRKEKKPIVLKMFLGILNLRSGVLQTFNAGHVDPIIKAKNGNIKYIKGPFLPLLGSTPDATYTALPLQLNPGDRVCFYSNDTINMQNADGEKYGTERLLKNLSTSGNDADKAIKSIYHGITEFTGKTQLDADIAIAILEYTPSSNESKL